MLVLCSEVLELEIDVDAFSSEFLGSCKKFAILVGDPGGPLEDALLADSEETGEDGLEFIEILVFGVGGASILGNRFLLRFIDCDSNEDGQQTIFHEVDEDGVPLFEGIFEVLYRHCHTLTAKSLTYAM